VVVQSAVENAVQPSPGTIVPVAPIATSWAAIAGQVESMVVKTS
jgi:hypothetical protein